MFSINDFVFYSTTGVCQITDIKSENFGNSEAQEYYVLKPLTSNALTYVATHNVSQLANMRRVMTRDEIAGLIHAMPGEKEVWLRDDRQRCEQFNAMLKTGDCHQLVKIIKTLYLERQRKKGSGKRLNWSDNQTMTIAEKLLYEEFSFVMGIPAGEVVLYIRARIPRQSQSI